jgi:release factor glutamine methyltransferase
VSAIALPRRDVLPRRLWRAVLRAKLALHDRRKYEGVVVETIGDLNLVVLPDVFNPVLLRSGAFLAAQARRLAPGARVLDLGSGSGACGIAAAQCGCTVTAVDINPSAVRCTRINALVSNVDIDIHHGDLFAPVSDERFDVVLFNPPYYRGTPADGLDHAWRSKDVPERFAANLSKHLAPGGYALVVLSTDGEPASFLRAFEHNGLSHQVVMQRDFVNEVMSIYRVAPAA